MNKYFIQANNISEDGVQHNRIGLGIYQIPGRGWQLWEKGTKHRYKFINLPAIVIDCKSFW